MTAAPVVAGAATDASGGRARKRAALVLVCAVALIAAPLLGAPASEAAGKPYGIKPKPKPKPQHYNVVTRFAVAEVQRPIYQRPNLHSRVVRRLQFYTPDSEALQTYRFVSARRVRRTLWQRIDVPGRPNGQTGWVQRSWLGQTQTSRTLIVVSRETQLLHVYRGGRLIFTAPVGVGDTAKDWTTPGGRFWIAEEFPSSDAFYGPWAFGTTDYATDTEFPDGSIVGIHGTNEPWLIPGDPSHGCIRLKDPDILRLKLLVGIGTAVWIE